MTPENSPRGSSEVISPKLMYRSPRYKSLPSFPSPTIKQALLCAASRLTALDSDAGPVCLIRLGDLPIVCHALVQLHHAGIERVVVLCGFQGEKIQEAVFERLPEEVQRALRIEFVLLGDDWQKGTAASILKVKDRFWRNDKFLVCMSTHIFDPHLIASMCTVPFKQKAQMYALVETDCQGLVGMPTTTNKVQLDKTDISDLKVKHVSQQMDLNEAQGVTAGMFACDTALFDKLAQLASGQVWFTLADAMNLYLEQNSLKCIKTDSKMWFGVETRESLAHAVRSGLKDIGTVPDDSSWLSEGAYDQAGKQIRVFPMGRGQETHNKTGSTWSEFSVERWRSAVYINMSYFGELYPDTISFVTDIAKHIKLRGERVSLIEVGCGTGEFIRPIVDHFQVSIGVDFNANFIEFCNDHLPKGKEDKAVFVHGDACELVELMKRKAPSRIWSDTRVVTCVGNTMGIIPEELKKKVYQQMAELAGPNGVVVIVYWNARWFGDACQNFYFANPQLCGPFDGSAIDFATTTLQTPPPTSYRSHWTGIDEARRVLKENGLEEIVVEEKGKGVLAAARQPCRAK